MVPAYATPTVAYTTPPQPSEIPERALLQSWIRGAPTTLELQGCLSNLGYDVGTLDGIDGPKTSKALNQWTAAGTVNGHQELTHRGHDELTHPGDPERVALRSWARV